MGLLNRSIKLAEIQVLLELRIIGVPAPGREKQNSLNLQLADPLQRCPAAAVGVSVLWGVDSGRQRLRLGESCSLETKTVTSRGSKKA